MNPSEYEIQREVEALRDIRRRSAAPGALTIDPDLPTPSSQNPYWVNSSTENDSSSSSSHDDASSSSSHTDATSHKEDDPFHLFWVPASVHPEIAPAEFRAFLKEHSRSPPPADGSAPPPSRSSSLSSTNSLGRRSSMLSRQYRPSENDGVGEKEEKIVPLRRNRSYLYHSQGPQLTISDLQKLEQLAEEASENDDPTKLRTMLRRSLSLNISPTALDKMDRVPDMADEADAPIIIPPPNSIVRRTARTTKFRKPSLAAAEGEALRGSSRRRGTTRPGPPSRPSSDQGDHGEPVAHKRVQSLSESTKDQRASQDSFDEALIYDAYVRDEEEDKPLSTSVSLPKTTSPPPTETAVPSTSTTSLPEPRPSPSLLDALGPILHTPEPQSVFAPQPSPEQPPPPRTPSPPRSQETPTTLPASQLPASSPQTSPEQRPPVEQQPSFLDTPPTPQQVPPPRKEKKGQKSIFKWGSDKSSKKQAKEAKGAKETKEAKEAKEAAQQQGQPAETKEPKEPKEPKEKESGFFGSLFSKKSNKESSSSSSHGHETASSHGHGKDGGASLGANKNQQPTSPATPGFGTPAPGGGIINNYSRYPLHVERAIYRLSHIKLANPRRPLYEQVLISNLMFWYLGVINRAQGQQQQQQQQQQVSAAGPQPAQGPPNVNGTAVPEDERASMDEQQRNPDQERMEVQQQQPQHVDMRQSGNYNNSNTTNGNKRESSPKRGSLTKAPPAGQGGRRGEMVVKGPQYDMQHRAMEQEYGGYGQPQQAGRGGGPPSQQWGQQQQQHPGAPNNQPPRLVPQQQPDENPFYYSVDMVQQPQPQQRLPPGAMAPLDQSNWSSGDLGNQPQRSPPPNKRSSTSPGPERRSRSPPQLSYTPGQQGLMFQSASQENLTDNKTNGGYDYGQQHHRPSRSLSATAVPSASASMNGKVKKGVSAHAAVPSHRGRPRNSEPEKVKVEDGIGEEEDVPLAVYQQQRRR
ncbi:hypothetical protein V5O48_016115 [Marasmius crinis-equi]|uniref:Protein Zds1 C-terminal domain-containing protein n=1 Tax=Marasmius crinis-equi TaxID=585013 RepID=A0ABR3ESL3_9AGAR